MADWTSNANESLCLKLVRTNDDEASLTKEERVTCNEFHPTFTYPIFGDQETIYGYKNLSIKLFFASGSLSMYLNVSSSEKLPSKAADDIEGTLYKFIPPNYNKSFESFRSIVEKDAVAFKPLGEKIYSYTRRAPGKGKGKGKETGPVEENDPDAVVFEVYHCTWETPGFREYHRRMQLFILLFIEGGSYIVEDEDKWEFTILYERRSNHLKNSQPENPASYTYHFAGYSSLYPFWCWPDKIRLRLSQFVVLPPYQHAGHGSALYNAIYQLVLGREDVVELTVEDPSEAFEDLRDRNDLKMLMSLEAFMQEGTQPTSYVSGTFGKFGPPADKGWVAKWRRDRKIASRQFHRLIEMLILQKLEPSAKQAQKAFRLQVKERLYRFNYEILSQLEKNERLEKLEETFQTVRTDYQRILATVK